MVAGFDGGDIASNAPEGLLLGLVDRGLGLIHRFAEVLPRPARRSLCRASGRDNSWAADLRSGAGGYEDLNDHDELRKDPVFKTGPRKLAPVLPFELRGFGRQSTLNRVEHTPERHSEKYKKFQLRPGTGPIRCWSISFLRRMKRAPRRDRARFRQYRHPAARHAGGPLLSRLLRRILLSAPLYVFCGRDLLLARQRCANVAGSDGAVEEAARIIAQIRQKTLAARSHTPCGRVLRR